MLSRRAAHQTSRCALSTSRIAYQQINLLIWIRSPRGCRFASSVNRHRPDNPCGLWLLSNPSDAVISKMISQMPRLNVEQQAHFKKATFLITPSLANLFTKPGGLHSRIINHIHANAPQENPPQSFVAVVDGLPGPEHFGRIQGEQRPFPVYEGIAMLLSESRRHTKLDGIHADRSTVRFRTKVGPTSQDWGEVVSYEVPIANTLFVNGQQNTFFRQKWVYDQENTEGVPWRESQELRDHLQQIEVTFPNWNRSHERFSPNRHVVEMTETLETLTEAVQVNSSMGNIVREIQMVDGKSVPASTELEQIVPEFVKERKKSTPDGSLRVFALVYPPNQTEGMAWPKALQKGSQTGTSLQAWLLAGASLHQVTSGGGGWGKKQGLLSLDPAVSFDKRDFSKSGLLANLDIDADDISMPKTEDLVPPGHMIQFFAHFQCPPKPGNLEQVQQGGTDMSEWTQEMWHEPKETKYHYCFATTLGLDSSDFLSQTASTPLDQKSDESELESHSTMLSLPWHFGLLTTGPIAISNHLSPDPQFPIHLLEHELRFASLVNIPDTTFNARFLWQLRHDRLKIRKYASANKLDIKPGPKKTVIRRVTLHDDDTDATTAALPKKRSSASSPQSDGTTTKPAVRERRRTFTKYFVDVRSKAFNSTSISTSDKDGEHASTKGSD